MCVWGNGGLLAELPLCLSVRPPAEAFAAEMSSLLSLQEENRILQQELSRVEDLLAQSRAERDELAIKYNAISERVGVPEASPSTACWQGGQAGCRVGSCSQASRGGAQH